MKIGRMKICIIPVQIRKWCEYCLLESTTGMQLSRASRRLYHRTATKHCSLKHQLSDEWCAIIINHSKISSWYIGFIPFKKVVNIFWRSNCSVKHTLMSLSSNPRFRSPSNSKSIAEQVDTYWKKGFQQKNDSSYAKCSLTAYRALSRRRRRWQALRRLSRDANFQTVPPPLLLPYTRITQCRIKP